MFEYLVLTTGILALVIDVDCVSIGEKQALQDLYTMTQGSMSWKSKWNILTDPCFPDKWYGIDCVFGNGSSDVIGM